jgi:hypothetical protein
VVEAASDAIGLVGLEVAGERIDDGVREGQPGGPALIVPLPEAGGPIGLDWPALM